MFIWPTTGIFDIIELIGFNAIPNAPLSKLKLFLYPVSKVLAPSPKAKPPCWINSEVTPPILLAISAKYLFIEDSTWYWGLAKSFKVSIALDIDSDCASVSPSTEPVPVFAFWAENASDVVVVFVPPIPPKAILAFAKTVVTSPAIVAIEAKLAGVGIVAPAINTALTALTIASPAWILWKASASLEPCANIDDIAPAICPYPAISEVFALSFKSLSSWRYFLLTSAWFLFISFLSISHCSSSFILSCWSAISLLAVEDNVSANFKALFIVAFSVVAIESLIILILSRTADWASNALNSLLAFNSILSISIASCAFLISSWAFNKSCFFFSKSIEFNPPASICSWIFLALFCAVINASLRGLVSWSRNCCQAKPISSHDCFCSSACLLAWSLAFNDSNSALLMSLLSLAISVASAFAWIAVSRFLLAKSSSSFATWAWPRAVP